MKSSSKQEKSMSKYSFSLLIVIVSLFLMSEAYAASSICNFQTVTDVNFGSYDVLSSLNNDSTGSFVVDCSASWTTVISSIGISPNSGGFNPRKMKLTTGTDLLDYYLYTNSSRSTIWGDGTQGSSTVTSSVQKNHPLTITIYGRIPPGQNVGIGNYGEVLIITINF
jgi:spore coat protein U-like protein